MRIELRHQLQAFETAEALLQSITSNVLSALQHPHIGVYETTIVYSSGPGTRFEDAYSDLAVLADVAPSVRIYAQTIPTSYRLDPELLERVWSRLVDVQDVKQIPLALRGWDGWYWRLAQVAWLAAKRLQSQPILTYVIPPHESEGIPLPATFITVYVNVPEED